MGGTLTNFLDLPPSPPAAGSSSGLRPFFLSRVPRPGPWLPPSGSMSRFALADDPAPTPLPPGSSRPAAAAQQLAPQPAAAPHLISMPGCARLMNIQRRRLAPARLPHFRPDPQLLPMREGRGWREGAEASYLPGGPNHSDPRGGGIVVSGRRNSAASTRNGATWRSEWRRPTCSHAMPTWL